MCKEQLMNKATDDPRKRAERIVLQQFGKLEAGGGDAVGEAKAADARRTMTTPRDDASQATRPTEEKKPNAGVVARSLFDAPIAENTVAPEQRAAALEAIRCEVAACTRCKVLADSRTQTVFGVGNPNAKICFFGEAPGADEDRLGEPFVGRGGQLLNKMLAACRLQAGGRLHSERAQVPAAGEPQSAAG